MLNVRLLRRRQQGAVIITVCLLMLFLLGFMGIALGFSRAFVVKSELQTAMDSCALAAAQELDGTANARERARNAGVTAGNLNKVAFQSNTWGGEGQLTTAEVTFWAQDLSSATSDAAAVYAECAHTQPDVELWLMKAMALFNGTDATYNGSQNIAAKAVAKRASAQSTCPIPLALKPKAGGVKPDYGFTPGEWITLLMGPGEATNGEIGWANLDGSNSASETVKEMNGHCGTKVGDTLGTPGVQAAVADVWNYRFGIYKNNVDPSVAHQRPDFSGYAYRETNWAPCPATGACINNAYSGSKPAASHATAQNFELKRASFASCGDTTDVLKDCETITGLKLSGFKDLAKPGNVAGGHKQYGTNRRIVVVPVVDGAAKVIDYACMLMLEPLSIPMVPVKLEYIGNAGTTGSPCTTNGLPGGSAGPLVPVLVR